MARQYNHTAIGTYYDWFGLEEEITPTHINILLKQWHNFIFSLQKEVNKDTQLHNIAKKPFIINAIKDSFAMFTPYSYSLNIGKEYDDFDTELKYHLVTVNCPDNDIVEYTIQDVGSPSFAKAFKRVTNIDISEILVEGIPSKIVNSMAFTIYTNALVAYNKLADKQEVKMPDINALLIWADEHNEWVFKVSANTPEYICKKYKEYLLALYTVE